MKPYVQGGLSQANNLLSWDFLVIQQLKNQPCNAGDVGSVPGQELRSHMPWSDEAHANTELVCYN